MSQSRLFKHPHYQVEIILLCVHGYLAVASDGATVEFMLSPGRDAVSAKRFFRKALRARHTVAPRVINVDRNPSYPKAVGKLKREGTLLPSCRLVRSDSFWVSCLEDVPT